MTLRVFVTDNYPIKNKIKLLTSDPIKQIMEQDDLPCDAVKYIDGVLQKVVYISDDEYIPVVDLLSYQPDEVHDMSEDFRTAYFAYMDNVDIEDLTLEAIMSASRDYLIKTDKRKELLIKCTQ